MVWTNSTLVEHRLSEDEKKVLTSREYNPETMADIIKSLSVGEFVTALEVGAREDRAFLLVYLEQLKQQGLDIGRRNSEYGYRMPIQPSRIPLTHKLKIFRRR